MNSSKFLTELASTTPRTILLLGSSSRLTSLAKRLSSLVRPTQLLRKELYSSFKSNLALIPFLQTPPNKGNFKQKYATSSRTVLTLSKRASRLKKTTMVTLSLQRTLGKFLKTWRLMLQKSNCNLCCLHAIKNLRIT